MFAKFLRLPRCPPSPLLPSAATSWSDGLDGSRFRSGFGSGFALWDSCLGVEMGAEVSTWYPPSGVSVCTSACDAKETLHFLCFLGPSTLPINSISDGPSAAMAAAYAVALAFLSSKIGVFGGILEVHVMIEAIGVESLSLHLNWGLGMSHMGCKMCQPLPTPFKRKSAPSFSRCTHTNTHTDITSNNKQATRHHSVLAIAPSQHLGPDTILAILKPRWFSCQIRVLDR